MKPTFKPIIYSFTLFSISLLVYRLLKSDSLSYIFLAWNLFLAFIPFWISDYLKRKDLLLPRHLPVLGIWLLFLPNAPYILTDLFHFKQRPFIPLWFDLILVASFALIGFILFYKSLSDVVILMRKQVNVYYVNLAVPCVFALTAFGLYMGRYLRFNSWDIVQHPFRLVRESVGSLFCKDTIGFVAVFGTFMWLVYLTMSALYEQKKSD